MKSVINVITSMTLSVTTVPMDAENGVLESLFKLMHRVISPSRGMPRLTKYPAIREIKTACIEGSLDVVFMSCCQRKARMKWPIRLTSKTRKIQTSRTSSSS